MRANIGVDNANVLRFSAGSEKQSNAFVLSVFPDGTAALILRDAQGRNRIGIGIREDGRPVISMDEDANLIMRDNKGRNRVVLGASTEGGPRLTLYDEKSVAKTVKSE